MDPQELFLSNLDAIDRAIAFVCHRNHLTPQDSEEFGSEVKAWLIEANYAVIRKFEGRSAFSTYLTSVVMRMYFQWRIQMWGKWRPSAAAKRLGENAITLERLLIRDGYSYGEAVETLTRGSNPACSREELDALYVRLPRRLPRPVLVTAVPARSVPTVDGELALFSGERAERARAAAHAIDEAIAAMDPESEIILRLRFWHNRKVPEIARALGLDEKRLYRRIHRLLQVLRDALEDAGIDKAEIVELLERADHELAFSSGSGRKTKFRHSQSVDGEFGEGESTG